MKRMLGAALFGCFLWLCRESLRLHDAHDYFNDSGHQPGTATEQYSASAVFPFLTSALRCWVRGFSVLGQKVRGVDRASGRRAFCVAIPDVYSAGHCAG